MVAFCLVLPAVLLLVIGTVFPGATEVNAELGNKSLVKIYAPATAVMALLTLGIAMLPQALGLDRERGILRMGFLIAFVLSAAALLGIGVLIGALVPTGQAGVDTGMLLYLPMLFLAGIYLPLEIMPAGLRSISGWTPGRCGCQRHRRRLGWHAPTATSVLVLGVTGVAAAGLASRLFRWE